MRFFVCERIFTYAQSRICEYCGQSECRKVYIDELAGGGTYLHRDFQSSDNASPYYGNPQYGRYADCLL